MHDVSRIVTCQYRARSASSVEPRAHGVNTRHTTYFKNIVVVDGVGTGGHGQGGLFERTRVCLIFRLINFNFLFRVYRLIVYSPPSSIGREETTAFGLRLNTFIDQWCTCWKGEAKEDLAPMECIILCALSAI